MIASDEIALKICAGDVLNQSREGSCVYCAAIGLSEIVGRCADLGCIGVGAFVYITENSGV